MVTISFKMGNKGFSDFEKMLQEPIVQNNLNMILLNTGDEDCKQPGNEDYKRQVSVLVFLRNEVVCFSFICRIKDYPDLEQRIKNAGFNPIIGFMDENERN